ncbi:MAG: tRNA uridine-5-carboxymethylaminomethyl(34) synthesis GTPase MnmE [Eubacterium sp.]|nr:tRNA uridine-5-carboxymethylaminomethyl(34) synthesis GTPase MnmE [Eubacterium sp.]
MNKSLFREDTIAAIATGIGGAGIGIIRVSGPEAVALAEPLFKNPAGKTLKDAESHKLLYGHIVDPEGGRVVDEVLVSKMTGPFSYTAEDVVEINCHGGIVSLKKILGLLLAAGVRLAEPGEFTKRAFLNGRIDLTQAEAVMDIISAKTEKSMENSVGQLEGRLSERIDAIDDRLVDMLSDMEANIDYPEYDIEEETTAALEENITRVIEMIDALLQSAQTGRIYREGITTAILGEPNVGKSSLLNALLMENKAIVTDIPGTTRDVIEEYVHIQGIPFKIIDTAGIRETDNLVEKIGVEKSRQLIKNTSLVLFLTDVTRPFSEAEKALLKELNPAKTIFVANKMDAVDSLPELPGQWLPVSIKTEAGVEALKERMVAVVMGGEVDQEADYLVNNVRHIQLLKEAKACLGAGLETIAMAMPLELVSIDLKNALEKLREITGRAVGEDIVDRIFSKFCIGK